MFVCVVNTELFEDFLLLYLVNGKWGKANGQRCPQVFFRPLPRAHGPPTRPLLEPSMHVLFVHKNFPAQFGHIASHLIHQHGHQCTFVSETEPRRYNEIEKIQYTTRGGATAHTHYCARTFENGVWHAAGVYEARVADDEVGVEALLKRAEGFVDPGGVPDAVLERSGAIVRVRRRAAPRLVLDLLDLVVPPRLRLRDERTPIAVLMDEMAGDVPELRRKIFVDE